MGLDLTRRCGLEDRVNHVHADFLTTEQVFSDFDVVVSWFVFLHIPQRDRLLARCREALLPGGYLYVDDFHEIDRLTSEERESLAVNVFCEWLPSFTLFGTQCESAGFESVQVTDATAAGITFAAERIRDWRETRTRQIGVHGEAVTDGLDHFYQAVDDLFQGVHFGLAHLLARKPSSTGH